MSVTGLSAPPGGTPPSDVELTDEERTVVNDFCQLLDTSKHLFNGLRDVPQYGQKQWQSYFSKTFDLYTRLWKFQQQHRQTLDSKYGLKRWQIGEIASKIGQLYYHYYLRTSETSYLHEAYSFYSAIRMRAYYSRAIKEERPDLMVKKLRYYARFIVVCLLLKKMKVVRDLVRELCRHIDEYGTVYDSADHTEWTQVMTEIKAFIQSEPVSVVDDTSISPSDSPPPIIISHRLDPLTVPLAAAPYFHQSGATPTPLTGQTQTTLRLYEVIVVGNTQQQIKFSELSVDMFRMLQTFEREPRNDHSEPQYDTSPAPAAAAAMVTSNNVDNGMGKVASSSKTSYNPHKYLLYKPTFTHLYTCLATAFKELPPSTCMCMYISADGCDPMQLIQQRVKQLQLGDEPSPEQPNKNTVVAAYSCGGVLTCSKDSEISSDSAASAHTHCLHPGDLYPFTRKPLFLIVDSDQSDAYGHLPNLFDQPYVVLMSPQVIPDQLQTQSSVAGGLFTLFLHSPLMAMCHICQIPALSLTLWHRAQQIVATFMQHAHREIFTNNSHMHSYYHAFYNDDFLRVILLRYVFCTIVLRMHKHFKSSEYYPSSHPVIQRENTANNSNTLEDTVLELCECLNVKSLFNDHIEK